MKRKYWIDDLKMLACITVFLCHFKLMFTDPIPKLKELAIATPLSVFTNGTLAVFVFMILSAYLIASAIFRNNTGEKIGQMAFKRYPRLMLPVLAVSLGVYLLSQFGLLYSHSYGSMIGDAVLGRFYSTELTFTEFLQSSFVTVWWSGNNSFNAPFWMLTDLFKGSFYAIILSCITGSQKKRSVWIFLFLILVSFFTDYFMLGFTLGVFLAFAEQKTDWISVLHSGWWGKVLAFFCIIAAIVFQWKNDGITRLLSNYIPKPLVIGHLYFWCTVEAFLLILGLMILRFGKEYKERKGIWKDVSSMSFSVYLVHWPIICSLSCGLYLNYHNSFQNQYYFLGILFFITSVTVLIVSYLFYKIVEQKICNTVIKKITDWFFEKQV